jgi:hypothetical protein
LEVVAVWDAAQQIEGLAKKKLNARLGVKKELRNLPTHLSEGEQVLNLSSGTYDGASGLVVLTDRRVIFTSAGMVKSRLEDFPYGRVSSVQHSGGMMFGQLTIFSSGNKAELTNMAKDRAKEIADYIRDRISISSQIPVPPAEAATPPSASNSEDAFEKLKKLGELQEAGLITPEDFEQKKRELLASI